jgi:hypothetical protein
VKTALVQAEKVAKLLMDEIKAVLQKLETEGVSTQAGGRVIDTPGVLHLENARVFFKFAKQALQNLANAMGVILDHEFTGPHFHFVRDKAKAVLGENHPATLLLEADHGWIKNIVDMRGEEEHPKSGKPFARGFNIQRATGGEYEFSIDPPRFYNDLLVLDHLEGYSRDLLMFAEEVVALSLQSYFPKGVEIQEIPEERRDSSAPVRFRLALKERQASANREPS